MSQLALLSVTSRTLLGAALLVLACAFASSPVLAAKNGEGKSTSKRQSNRIKIQNTRSNSEETSAERDKRLSRECRGRPNGGACLGYAKP